LARRGGPTNPGHANVITACTGREETTIANMTIDLGLERVDRHETGQHRARDDD